jgi:hypothetical protein
LWLTYRGRQAKASRGVLGSLGIYIPGMGPHSNIVSSLVYWGEACIWCNVRMYVQGVSDPLT